MGRDPRAPHQDEATARKAGDKLLGGELRGTLYTRSARLPALIEAHRICQRVCHILRRRRQERLIG